MEHLLRRAASTATSVTVGAILLAGCAGGAASGTASHRATQKSGQNTWAHEIAAVARDTSNPTEREALSDGVITETEYEHFTTAIVDCFAELDLDASFDAYGTLSYNNPHYVPGEKTDKCNTDNGIRVVILRNAMIRNPDKIDGDELMTSCLRASGAVPDDYTATDLRNGTDFDRIYATDEFGECTLRRLEIIADAPDRAE